MSQKVMIQDLDIWKKMKRKGSLFSFDLELTARCNNNCSHCYINLPANDKVAKSQEMTLDEIDKISSDAISLGALWCLITGGEPLLRDDFFEIYTLLQRKGLLISLFTNATLINIEHIKLLKKYPPRDIEVTVYGSDVQTYEKVTKKPGSFHKFMKGVNLLLENGIKVRLKAMVLRDNVADIIHIKEFCNKYTADYFRFDPLLHLRYDLDCIRNSDICTQRLTPIEIVQLESSDPSRIGSLTRACEGIILDNGVVSLSNKLFHCGAGVGGITIGYDGKMRLCSSLTAEQTMFDLRRGNLQEAYNSFVPSIRNMESDRLLSSKCQNCELINLCLWCPAHAYLETGELDGETPYFCQVAHARAEMLRNATQK